MTCMGFSRLLVGLGRSNIYLRGRVLVSYFEVSNSCLIALINWTHQNRSPIFLCQFLSQLLFECFLGLAPNAASRLTLLAWARGVCRVAHFRYRRLVTSILEKLSLLYAEFALKLRVCTYGLFDMRDNGAHALLENQRHWRLWMQRTAIWAATIVNVSARIEKSKLYISSPYAESDSVFLRGSRD